MSTSSLRWLAASLAIAGTVSALPAKEKRADCVNASDCVTATINGQVVSWANDWYGTPASTAAPAPPASSTSTTPAAPAPTTTSNVAPAPSAPTTTPPPAACTPSVVPQPWVTATIDGVVVSWENNWPPQPTIACADPAPTTAAPAPSSPAPASTSSSPPPPAGPTNAASCKDVHIFLAKGNNEPYPGRQGKLVDAVCAGLPSCDYEDILFYNPVGYDYCAGVDEGGINGKAQMTAYAATCPLSKLVISGYSQGTDVVGNMLGGGGSPFGKPTPNCVESDIIGLDPNTAPGNQIWAVTLFGNTRHVAYQPYNVLSGSTVSTDNPRMDPSLAAMNQYTYALRDYCDITDPVCAAAGPGPFNVSNHLNYFDLYSNDAGAWIKTKLGY